MLIPKIKSVDALDQFRPIVFSNFKFKLISKTIVDILAALILYLVTHEQLGFIMEDIFMIELIFFLIIPLIKKTKLLSTTHTN